MDHRILLKSLNESERSTLTKRSNMRGLAHLASYLCALTLTSTLIIWQIPYWWLVLIPHGLLLNFLFTLSHETTHQTPFATPWLNDWIGHAIAPILALPLLWFRYFHLAHHKYTNDPERDPEIAGHPRPDSWSSYALYVTGFGYWTSAYRTLWHTAFRPITAPYLPPRKHAALRREAQIVLAIQAAALSTLFVSPMILWLWLVPVIALQPALRLYLLAEHGLCPPVANMLENTRTTYTGRLMRWLAWNMPYHIEHHSMPNVPFHQLPKLHEIMAPHLLSTSPSYGNFTKTYVKSLQKPSTHLTEN